MYGPRRENPDILVVADFTGNLDKFDRHVAPLSTIANPTVVCINAIEHEDITFKPTPSMGLRSLSLVGMFIHAFVEAYRHDYDAIVSFSLLPHGCFALVIGRLVRSPVHLGIIGADIDVHAKARYRRLVRFLFQQFDAISVPGSAYERDLCQLGISTEDVHPLTNPVPIDKYVPSTNPTESAEYDYLWIGRFCEAKDPVTFVEVMNGLKGRDREFRAVMVGDGPLRGEVEATVSDYGLDGCIDMPGWVDDPRDYYESSRIFLLTSNRDALPLTLLEAMATGKACVVPDVGNISDVVDHEQNGIIVDGSSSDDILEGLLLLERDGHYENVVRNAPDIRSEVSYEAASADWKDILDSMEIDADLPRGGPIRDSMAPFSADSAQSKIP